MSDDTFGWLLLGIVLLTIVALVVGATIVLTGC